MCLKVPKFDDLSIIVCSRKDSAGLKTTLKSLECLNNYHFELILVLSDYSQNEINNIRLSIKTNRLIILEMPASGIYEAMNYGISKVTREYILCLNGGDSIFSPRNLQKLLAKIADKPWGYGAISIVNPEDEKKARKYNFFPYFRLLHKLSLKYVPHPSTIYRTDFLKSLGQFDTTYRIAADQKLALLASKKIRPINSNLIISKFIGGGKSDNRSAFEIVEDFRNISSEIDGIFLKNQKFDKLIWSLLLKLRNR